jgi:predicted outer membrane repeat protein
MKSIIFLINVSMILAVLITGWVSSPASAISPAAATLDQILYVKPGAIGDCSSWDNACELQTALGFAVSADQIWVAAGTYKPTTTSSRTISFALKTGVALYGGFPADGGDWDSRDWQTNITTLSGDIGVPGQISDNSYHVVEANSVDAAAILDGFTISGGNADDIDHEDDGGGMDDRDGNPTLRNLVFSYNYAVNGGGLHIRNSGSTVTNLTFSHNTAEAGGGLHIRDSSPTLMNVAFSDNSAEVGGGLYIRSSGATLMELTFSNNSAAFGGGGLFASDNSSTLALTDITFADNTSDSVGGGMVNDQSSPTLTNVTFSGNSAVDYGGGLDNYDESSPTLTNVTFSGNSAPIGGGLFNTEGSNPSLTNITFTGNTANDGGGMYNWNSSPILTNAILWGNTPNQIANGGVGTPVVTFSDIQGGYAGAGNINLEPLLDSLADNGGLTRTHALLEDSPAIDAGSPTICPPNDQRYYLRPVDGDHTGLAVCDMGSYEYGPPLLRLYLPAIFR